MDTKSVFGDTPLELGEGSSLGPEVVSVEDKEEKNMTYEGGRGKRYLGSGRP